MSSTIRFYMFHIVFVIVTLFYSSSGSAAEEEFSVSLNCAKAIGVSLGVLTEKEFLDHSLVRVMCSVSENVIEVRFSKDNPMLRGGDIYVDISQDDFSVLKKKYPR